MSFNTIAQCAEDQAFLNRLTAALAGEHVTSPEVAVHSAKWPISADPSVWQPYASAVAAGNPNPGGDESVITDQALLSAVQVFLADD